MEGPFLRNFMAASVQSELSMCLIKRKWEFSKMCTCAQNPYAPFNMFLQIPNQLLFFIIIHSNFFSLSDWLKYPG